MIVHNFDNLLAALSAVQFWLAASYLQICYGWLKPEQDCLQFELKPYTPAVALVLLAVGLPVIVINIIARLAYRVHIADR